MQIQEAIHSRRTAHLWLDTPVPEGVILKGLEAAQMAPCHRMTWPWRFTLPGPRARERLYELGVALKAAKNGIEITDALRQRLTEKMLHPALVVVSQVVSEDPTELQEDYAACASAVQNLSLSVFADGYHSKWSTGAVTKHAKTYEMLEISPEEEQIIGFVWIGVPARAGPAPARPALATQIRRVP